jgi:hypothetical protein
MWAPGAGRVLHSDNGGPMKGSTMLATLQRTGGDERTDSAQGRPPG